MAQGKNKTRMKDAYDPNVSHVGLNLSKFVRDCVAVRTATYLVTLRVLDCVTN